MTWPTGPPPMPPSGWYDDPEHPWTWRYWDGGRWTDHRAPMWVPPARDPRSVSAWFERAVAVAKIAVRRVGVLLAVLWLGFGIAGWVLVMSMFDGARGRELRRLLDLDQNVFGGSTTSGELTDAEAERAWELIQDIFWAALPWMLLLGVGFVLLWAWSLALTARAVRSHPSDSSGGDAPAEPLTSLAVTAVRRAPAVVASGAIVLLVFAGVRVVAAVPVVLVALADGGGAAIVLTVVFVVLLVVAVSAWLWVRLSLAAVIAAAGGHGIGVGRSWELTREQFWYATGRLIITGLISGVAGGVINSVTGFGQFLDFAVYLAIVVVLQAVATAASVIVTVSGHLVTVDQLADNA